jgi:predicted O-methyltransferase YrrM
MMTFGFVKDYLRHRLTGKTRNSVHSPFVFELLNEVIYDYVNNPVYARIEGKKRGLLPNSRRKGNRPKADQLLYRLVRRFDPINIVELGTGMGISKLYLANAAPYANLTSLEPDGGLKHVAAKLPPLDFVFINYYPPADLYNFFETLLPKFKRGSILAISNIYGSPLAKQHWLAIKEHPQVTVTVDLFWLQLVFFRDEVVKEHFRIRF